MTSQLFWGEETSTLNQKGLNQVHQTRTQVNEGQAQHAEQRHGKNPTYQAKSQKQNTDSTESSTAALALVSTKNHPAGFNFQRWHHILQCTIVKI